MIKDDLTGRLWEGYARRVMPPDAHETQVTETRRAFYGGMAAMFFAVEELGASGCSDDEGAAMMMVMDCELRAFKEEVVNGTK